MTADTAGRSTRTLGDAMEIAWRSRALPTGDLVRSGSRVQAPERWPHSKAPTLRRPPSFNAHPSGHRPGRHSQASLACRAGPPRRHRTPGEATRSGSGDDAPGCRLSGGRRPVRRADRCGACCPPVSGHPHRGRDRQVKGVAAVLTYPPWRVEIVSDGRGCVPGRRAAGRSPRGDESRGRRSAK
jgi:hypothetical protein